ncbi:hypothetical protein GJV85_00585 [Sulfurimonas aquatica]|uniref:Uncharacterized protein n=1 Tax=Sulfurimonas aquatica TaxID=2672570 RepID=A0A975AY21_9BACT|nr:hypothetical protein [Sulfurimonas aquatica]QSZ40676.1 hypothetical protein GJV85_00585 [Sulfurimonas aquatica]
MTKREIKAINFTPKYDVLEDRVRLSINYEDINNRVDFMITRAFSLKLLPTLSEYMDKFYAGTLPQESNAPQPSKDTLVKNEQTSRTDDTNLELYKQGDELLKEVKFSYLKESKRTIIHFISEESIAVVNLDAPNMQQIFSVIKATIPYFSWGISQSL